MMVLSVRDLYVNYGSTEVLKGAFLEIEKGKISLLLGANGSGKSTLLKTVSGLKRPASGAIAFEGTRIDGTPPHEIVRLGIAQVPEGRQVFAPLTVRQNLELGAFSRRDRDGIAADLEAIYARFPVLREKQRQVSGMLSGGQQQMLAIARALMARPKVLLMDEPAAGLSPAAVNEIAQIITGLNREGITIVVVEHNIKLGLSLADRIYVLDNGQIAFTASASDLSAVEYAKKIYLGG
jgi:branched-chain amino acid transport system ATP-binding protein